jgi:hypothetical protein
MINATRLRRMVMARWRRRLIQRTIYVALFPYKLRIGILSERANAKSKKTQKVAGIMMPFFAQQSFIIDNVMHNIHFYNGHPNLHNSRKSSKEKRELSMTTDQTYCIMK